MADFKDITMFFAGTIALYFATLFGVYHTISFTPINNLLIMLFFVFLVSIILHYVIDGKEDETKIKTTIKKITTYLFLWIMVNAILSTIVIFITSFLFVYVLNPNLFNIYSYLGVICVIMFILLYYKPNVNKMITDYCSKLN